MVKYESDRPLTKKSHSTITYDFFKNKIKISSIKY